MQHTACLANETDFAGFRQTARELLASGVAPLEVDWVVASQLQAGLFAATLPAVPLADSLPFAKAAVAPAKVSAQFLALCQCVILHSNPARFGLLYRLLWRMQNEAGLRHDVLDADFVQAQHMAQAVRRDLHKMKAFVRFRTVHDSAAVENPAAGALHVAWFEPDHFIAEAAAPFFMRRFTQMRWAILTPACSLAWDGSKLTAGPGAEKADAPPADAGEALWLTYYQSIFNPARLKTQAMLKEMPRRYWKNLPEAVFISQLTAKADQRQHAMLEAKPTVPRRRIV